MPRPKETMKRSRGKPSGVVEPEGEAVGSQRSGLKVCEEGKIDSSWETSGMDID